MGTRSIIAAFLFLCTSWAAHGGEVEVLDVKVRANGGNSFSFSVTLKHGDEGWDHYANQFQVVAPSGDVLGTRVLLHPHVNEQPFTRSLNSVEIPEGLREVILRARDSQHGVAKKTRKVKLPGR